MNRVIEPANGPLTGTVRVPGDKSLSHRAVLFASMAEGRSHLSGLLDSEDVCATVTACEALGARVEYLSRGPSGLSLNVMGWGSVGPTQPDHPIDCRNSGTTARLLMGVLAPFPVSVTLVGDASLSRRPMRRVMEPLSRMGARFDSSEGGMLPVVVHGTGTIASLSYASPVASAQVKTAVLLAGIRAFGVTRVTEPHRSRDHTERLLPAFGVTVTLDDAPGVAVNGPVMLVAHDVVVPGDPSSSAFPLVAALLVPDSHVTVEGVALNPTRTGFLRVLERMGADITVQETGSQGAEPIGTVSARYTPGLVSTTISLEEIPVLIDEVPILALAAARADGTTRFEGVGELRVKESDRLSAVAEGLAAFGVTTRAGDDWLEIDGPATLHGAVLDSLGDHRLAMTWAVAGVASEGDTTIERFEAIEVSYPGFLEDLWELMGF